LLAGVAGLVRAETRRTKYLPVVHTSASPAPAPSPSPAPEPCSAGYPIAVEATTIDGDNFLRTPDEDGDGLPDEGWRIIDSGPYRATRPAI